MARGSVVHLGSRRAALLALATAICAALVGVAVVPAHGAEPPGESAPAVGDFAIGDGLEGLIDEESGSFGVTLAVGGVELRWDSRAAAAGDRFGLGAGWGYALGFVDTDGGTRLVPPSWGEVFEADASAPSGLRGYTLEDLKFRRLEADAVPAVPAAAFVVHELGGTSTYFSAAGDPVAAVSRHGEQTRWEWSVDRPHRLERVVDVDGMVTTLDWESEADTVIVRPGANLPADPAEPDRAWRVRFDGRGAIVAVVESAGGRTEFGYEGAELSTISNPAGARTRIEWQRFDDQVPRVRRVSTADPAGEELSARTWDRHGAALPSEWPMADGADATYGAGGSADARFSTTLSDGVTAVRSEYSGDGLLRTRDVVTDGAAGERMLRRQVFEYPESDGAGAGPVSGTLRSRPIAATSVRLDASGAERDERVSFEYDAFGRVVRQVAADGAVTETDYDERVPAGRELPVGLVTRRMVTTTDGLGSGEVSTLDEARVAVVATQTLSATAGAGTTEPVVTGRTEFEVEPDGFVSEQRVYPSGDLGALPAVTRWSEVTDLPAGTSTTVETTGVGTAAEASTSRTVSLMHGGVLATTDVFGQAATSAFDLAGRVVASTDVAGNTVRTAYESWQRDGRNATVVTGADEVVSTEVRDALGRVVTRTDNIDHGVASEGHVRVVESIDYDVPGTVTVTDAWGATVSVSKDAFGRELRRVGPSGLAHVTVYDDVADEVMTGVTPTGDLADAESVTTRRNDLAARTTHTAIDRTDAVPVPAETETTDGLGRPIAASDGFVRSTASYDAFGRPTTTTFATDFAGGARASGAAGGFAAERRFDGFGNGVEKRLADGTGQTSGGSREIDALGRTRSETDRAGRTTTYEYSLDGLVVRASRTDGHETRNEYDERTRALTRSLITSPVGPAVDTAYEYDARTGALLAVFDPSDRADSVIEYTYDAHRNLLTTTYPDGGRIRHGYDLHGRRTRTTDPAGNLTEFTYDSAGVLADVVQRDESGTTLARAGYEFDALDRLVELTRGNGVTTRYAYTSSDELASERTSVGKRTVSDRAYAYDARGLLTERRDSVIDDEGDERRTVTRYAYDERRRLVESVVDGDPLRHGEIEASGSTAGVVTTAYELSVAGDVLAETVTDSGDEDGESAMRTRRFEYTPIGELIAITDEAGRTEQRYDEAGNLIHAADGTRFTYDAANHPLTETTADGETIATAYWADGTRRSLSSTDAGGATSTIGFVWDGDDLIAETFRVGDERGTAAYLIGTGRHARTTTHAGVRDTAYFGTDRHGSVTDLTAEDGRVIERYAYSDYGAEDEGPGCAAAQLGDPRRNPFRYAGEYTDPSCRQHLAVRSYDSRTMRFTSMDTAAVMNPYAYTDANPVMRVDPSGNFFSPDDANGTYFALGLSALGLLTTAYAVLFPVASLSSLAYFALGVGAIGDALALITSSIRANDPGWLDDETDRALSQVDVLSGFALVGVIAASHNVWTRVQRWRATRLTARSRLVTTESRHLSFGGDGAGQGGAHLPPPPRTSGDSFEEIRLTPNSSGEVTPDISPKPSPRSGSYTFLIPQGKQVRSTGGVTRAVGSRGSKAHGGALRRSIDVPAVRVTEPGNVQEGYRLRLSDSSVETGLPTSPSGGTVSSSPFDPIGTTTTRWPTSAARAAE